MKVSTANLHDVFNAMTVGFDDIFTTFNRNESSNFPPHNIIKSGENTYLLEFALAGFGKDDVEVSIEDGNLHITGSQKENNEVTNYLHKGIAARSFKKSFRLDQDLEVVGGEMNNGILQIRLEKIIPDHKKPKVIELK